MVRGRSRDGMRIGTLVLEDHFLVLSGATQLVGGDESAKTDC